MKLIKKGGPLATKGWPNQRGTLCDKNDGQTKGGTLSDERMAKPKGGPFVTKRMLKPKGGPFVMKRMLKPKGEPLAHDTGICNSLFNSLVYVL